MPNLTGQSIGRYHILEQLGEGGMATVYKAYDTRLEREVAVKVLRTDQFIPAQLQMVLQRFEREAKSLAKLSHPNIVNILDYGEHEGMPYLVMEYMPGGTLKQKLGHALPWQEALRTLIPVARGLAYAHQHGIIHRDVKPANILLKESGTPVLTDFGIAKLLEAGDGHTLTGSGVGIGTPEYMAPEQGIGAKVVDARADVYALGIVLYEMVTGRKPYIADTPMAVVLKQMTDPLPRPTDFAPNLPAGVEYLLLKALSKQPDDRYADMNALIAAMEDLLAEVPTTPIAVSPVPTVVAPTRQAEKKAWARLRLSPRMLLVVGVVTAFILLVVFGLPWLAKQFPASPVATVNQVAPTATLAASAMTFAPAKVTLTSTPIPAIATLTSTPTASPTPTAISLTWKQISDGKEFSRDTVDRITLDSKNPNAISIVTRNSGIYESTDNGLSWKPSFSEPASQNLTDAQQWSELDQSGHRISYRIRTYNDSSLDGGRTHHVLEKSSDGKNWITVKTWPFPDSVGPNTMGFDPVTGLAAFFSNRAVLFKTQDAGNSWPELYDFPTKFISTLKISASASGTVYVGTQGFFLSEDGGNHWQEHSQGIGSIRTELLINSDSSRFYVVEKGTYSSDNWGGSRIFRVLRSQDGGITWETFSEQYGVELAFGPGKSLYYSLDDSGTVLKFGDAWEKELFGNYGLKFFANPKKENILYSIDINKNRWNNLETSIPIRISMDGGKTWRETNGAFDNSSANARLKLYFDRGERSVVYAVLGPGILRSSDGGQSWNECLSNNALIDSESALAIDPQNGDLVYVGLQGVGGIFVSRDGCKSWKLKYSGLQNYDINSVATDPNIPNVAYVGTQSGAYVSYDQGEHWGQINDGLVGSTSVYSIAVDAQSNVYATTPFGVFKLEKK